MPATDARTGRRAGAQQTTTRVAETRACPGAAPGHSIMCKMFFMRVSEGPEGMRPLRGRVWQRLGLPQRGRATTFISSLHLYRATSFYRAPPHGGGGQLRLYHFLHRHPPHSNSHARELCIIHRDEEEVSPSPRTGW